MKRSILLCQEIHAGSGICPGVETSVDHIGKMALERSASLAWRLAFGDLARKEGPGLRIVALLDDRDAIEGGIQLAVAASVKAIPPGRLPRSTGNRRRS